MRMIPETRKLAMKVGFGLVAGLFVLAALSETAGFGMGLAARPLPCPTITPPPATRSPCPGTIWYSTYLGGSADETYWASEWGMFEGIAVDGEGNVYVTGATNSTDFPTTHGAYDTTYNGGASDVFVAKFNNSGGLLYSTYLGGSVKGWEVGYGIAVDGTGSVYITGKTDSSDFPTTPGAFDRTYNGGSFDAFVAKLSADGSSLVYSTFLGGKNEDKATGIAVNSNGNAHVTGATYSSNFPTTLGAFDRRLNGYDAFVTKLDSTGSALVYSTYLGGSGDEPETAGIAIDSAGNAYVSGTTIPPGSGKNDFPTTPGAFDRTFNGMRDVFVTKLNAAGSALVYSTYLGGSNFDRFRAGIAVDTPGNAYVGGDTLSTDFPTTPGAFDTTRGGTWDAFVTKLNAAGSALVYSTYLGGQHLDAAVGLAVDSLGQAHVSGRTQSVDFPTTSNAFDPTTNGLWDTFLTKFDATGSSLVYSTIFGGSGSESALGLAMDPGGDAWITGSTNSTDFPCTEDAFDTTYNGGAYDTFVTRIER